MFKDTFWALKLGESQPCCNHLNTGLVWYSNVRFVLVSSCQMLQYSNGGLKTGLKKYVYDLNVRYSDESGIQMVTVNNFDVTH